MQIRTNSEMSEHIDKFVAAFDGKVVCFAERYERHGGGGLKNSKYKGPLVRVLAKIQHKHQYGVDLDDMGIELGREVTATDLIENIACINGDGCDYIFYLETNGVKLELGHVEEDDEWEEC